MSQYYRAQRTRNIYNPASSEPFRLSRSKIDLYLNCPRCFYLDRRLGIAQPPGYPFLLNSAVDELLKKEFDLHRAAGTPHPLMKAYGIDAVPLSHESLEQWRQSLTGGITYLVPETNLLVTGGVDDVWVNPDGELIIVDYKATSKKDEVTLDADWQIGYKRQMEIYQWLFRMNGFRVSNTGYFVYCNGNTDRAAFDGKLEFDIKLLPYTGDTSWVEKIVLDIYKTLNADVIPSMSEDCDFCLYTSTLKKVDA